MASRRHFLTNVALVVATGTTFTAAVAASAVLHLGSAPARRIVAYQVTAVLNEVFEGRLAIDRVDRIGFRGIGGATAHVYDAQGHEIIRATGIRAKASLGGIGASVLSSLTRKTVMRIPVSEVTVQHAEVLMVPEGNGSSIPTIARAFLPRPTPNVSGTPGPDVDVDLSRIYVGHAWVHGELPGIPRLDVDLTNVEGRVKSGGVETNVDVTSADLVVRSLVAREIRGHAEAYGTFPSAKDGAIRARGQVDARAGDIDVHANATIDGSDLTASVDVPAFEAEALRALLPQSPLEQKGEAHIAVKGTLPNLNITASVNAGASKADVDGSVTIGAGVRANAHVKATDIDVRAFAKDGPSSKLNAEATANVVVSDAGTVSGTFDAHTTSGVVAGQRIPAVDATGAVAGTSVKGSATVHEPGVPTSVTFDLHDVAPAATAVKATTSAPIEAASVVDFTTTSRVSSLASIPRLGLDAPVKANGRVTTRGRVNLTTMTIDARATLAAKDLYAPLVHAAEAEVTASVKGPFRALVFDTKVAAVDVDVQQGGMHFLKVDATARGPLTALAVHAYLAGSETAPNVELYSVVGFQTGGAFTLRDAHFMVERDEVVIRGQVKSLRATASSIDIKEVAIEGLGESTLRANIHIDPEDLAIDAESEKIELARIATILGIPDEVTSGVASFEAFAGVHGKIPYGEVTLEASDIRAYGQEPMHARVSAVMDGSKLVGTADIEMDTIGVAHVDSNVDLDGSALKIATWRKASGAVSLDAHSDIAKLSTLIRRELLPVQSLTGELSVKGSVFRQGDTIPDLRLFATTKNLAIVGRNTDLKGADGTVLRAKPGFQSRDIDADVTVSIDGESGFSELSTVLRDPKGKLVFVNAKADVPVMQLLENPSQARDVFEHLPISAHIEIPRRKIEELPAVLSVLPLTGEVTAGVDLTGTVFKPVVDLTLRGYTLKPSGSAASNDRGLPLDLTTRASYDGHVVSTRIMVARRARTVFDLYGVASAPLDGILDGIRDSAPLPWDASFRAQLDKFALEDVSPLVREKINGAVSGQIALDNVNSKPNLDIRLTMEKLAIGKAEVPKAALSFLVDTTSAKAAVRLEQKDGYASASVTAPVKWVTAIPRLDTTRSLDFAYDVSRLRLAAFAPFVRSVLGSLDGRIDGKGSVHLDPSTGEGNVQGTLAVSEAKFHIVALGDELHDVKATAKVDEWGTVRIVGIEASGVTGRATGSASAKLKGFSVQSAEAKVNIGSREPLPISLQGVPLGEAWGDIEAKAEQNPAKDGYSINVAIPTMHFDLPDVVGRTLQEIGSDATVRMGTNTAGGFVLLRPEKPWQTKETSDDAEKVVPTKLHVAVKLGNDVVVTRGTSIQINLTGAPVVDYDGTTRMSGEITTSQGYLEIQGKRFQVERAVVSFTGSDPANPTVVATAYYDAPDRTRVFADFVGPVKTGKLTLHSDPPHTNDEIVAILLFGSADGALGAATPSNRTGATEANTAVAVGGGFVAEGLNQALSGISPYVTARITTNESNNPRPELAVQVSKTVSARVGYNLGLPAPGQNPDRTMLMLDWRFRRRWSMLTTVGDRGSSILDFIWHLRY